jgi:hypothetical protein
MLVLAVSQFFIMVIVICKCPRAAVCIVFFLEEIKSEFEQNAENPSEYEDKYGFLVETDAQVNHIGQNGLSSVESSYNVLGMKFSSYYLVCEKL